MRRPRPTLGALLALNVLLVAVLALVSFAPSVQAGGLRQNAGDYIMVGGSINGSTSNAVYVLDQRSGTLLSFLYDRSSRKLRGLSVRSVSSDARRFSPSR